MNLILNEDPSILIDVAIVLARNTIPSFDIYVEDKQYLLNQDDQSIVPPSKDIFLLGMEQCIDDVLDEYGLSFFNEDVRDDFVSNAYNMYTLVQFISSISLDNLKSDIETYKTQFEVFTTSYFDSKDIDSLDDDATDECMRFFLNMFSETRGDLYSNINDIIRFSDKFVEYVKSVYTLTSEIPVPHGSVSEDTCLEVEANKLYVIINEHVGLVAQLISRAISIYEYKTESVNTVNKAALTSVLVERLRDLLIWLKPTIKVSFKQDETDRYIFDSRMFTNIINNDDEDKIQILTGSPFNQISSLTTHICLALLFELNKASSSSDTSIKLDITYRNVEYFKKLFDELFSQETIMNVSSAKLFKNISEQLLNNLSHYSSKNIKITVTTSTDITVTKNINDNSNNANIEINTGGTNE